MTDSELDAALARLTSDKAAREGLVAEDDEEHWMRARNRRDSSGSYRELERCLEMLDEHHRRALHLVYDYGIPISGRGIWNAEAEGVHRLAALMPAKIKVPRSMWEPIRDLRARIIRACAGVDSRILAKYVGTSQKHVREVLAQPSG